MMNLKTYFKECLVKEESRISKIIYIDNLENGTNYDVNYIYNIIDKEILFNVNNYNTVIMEGNFVTLINVLNECNKDLNIVVATMDDYAINNYIKEIYKEYSRDLINKAEVSINEHFKIEDEKPLIIGSNAFINEMKRIFKNSNIIQFEI